MDSAELLPVGGVIPVGRRFEGMERLFGKAEDSPSDAEGTPAKRGRSHRQVRRISRSVRSAPALETIDFWLIFVPFGH